MKTSIANLYLLCNFGVLPNVDWFVEGGESASFQTAICLDVSCYEIVDGLCSRPCGIPGCKRYALPWHEVAG